MGRQPGFLAGLDVLGLEIALVGDDVDLLDFEDFARRLGGRVTGPCRRPGSSLPVRRSACSWRRPRSERCSRRRRACAPPWRGCRDRSAISGLRRVLPAASASPCIGRASCAAPRSSRRDFSPARRRSPLPSTSPSSSRLRYSSSRSSAALMNFSSEFRVKLRSLLLTALMRVPSTPAVRARTDRADCTAA